MKGQLTFTITVPCGTAEQADRLSRRFERPVALDEPHLVVAHFEPAKTFNAVIPPDAKDRTGKKTWDLAAAES